MTMRSKQDDPDRLGLNAAITRRDFINTSLIGSGAALLSMQAPGLLRPAAAAMPPAANLGADWTGYGGTGDYAAANGNTADVVNAAHGIAQGRYRGAAVEDLDETFDMVVVGAGFGGLGAAYTFMKEAEAGRSCLLLDNHAIFGGEAKQNEFEVDGTRLTAPQGSNGMVWPPEIAAKYDLFHRYWHELGLPARFEFQDVVGSRHDLAVPPDHYTSMYSERSGATTGYFFDNDDGGQWVVDPWRNGFRDAPLAGKVKQDLVRLDDYYEAPEREDWEQWLDSMTYREFITRELNCSPEVMPFVDKAFATAGGGLGGDQVSAYTGFDFYLPGVRAYTDRFYETRGIDPAEIEKITLVSWPGGNTGTARHFVKAMIPDAIAGGNGLREVLWGKVNRQALDRPGQQVRIRLDATAVHVEHNGKPDRADLVNVVYHRGGKLYRVKARTVVMASGGWVNKHILHDLPKPHREAYQQFHHAPILTVNVAVRNWQFMERLGIAAAQWFSGFGWYTNLRRQMLIDGQADPLHPDQPTVLTFYVPYLSPGLPLQAQTIVGRNQLFAGSYRDIELQVRKQMQKLFGMAGFDAKRDIAAIILNRWGHAYIAPQPGFYFGRNGAPAPREVIREGYGRITFGHSELTGQQLWSRGVEEGERAAKQALSLT
ncbi:MAG: NAD(P)-binding protein [Gammaproteobacteria bacterium]|nr:NAD(P)-binding protein [Gammaproteobacteria bacterium]